MSAVFQHASELRGRASADVLWAIHIVRRAWHALLRRQDEHAAFAQLSAMSDRELRDIGLARSEIGAAVRGEVPRAAQPRR